MIVRLLLILLLAASSTGCSLAFTSGPPKESERGPVFSCTTSYLAPILDLVWVGYALSATAAEKTGGAGGGDIALSALWIGSAAYGFRNVSRCKTAIEEATRRETVRPDVREDSGR